MKLAGQEFVANDRTGMLNSDATHLSTLVSAAGPLLGAPPLAPGVISSALQLHTRQLLVQGSAPALDTGHEGAGWTLARVTWCSTLMRRGGRATAQRSSTHLVAQRHWVSAPRPGARCHWGLATWTVGDPGWSQRTRPTLSLMTELLALMLATVKRLGANFATSKMRRQTNLLCTQNIPGALTTKANLIHADLTRVTVPAVTASNTIVLTTAQHLATGVVAHQLHLTLDPLGLCSTVTCLGDDCSAGVTRPRMAKV